MWTGISKTYAAGAYTNADWLSVIGAWLQANPGQLDVNYIAGQRLEWKSKAPRPDRAHFMLLSSLVMAVDAPGWQSEAGAVNPQFGDTEYSPWPPDTGSAYNAEFCIETLSGRAWMSVTQASGNARKFSVMDVLQRGMCIPQDTVSPVFVVTFERNITENAIFGKAAPAYRVDSTGARVAPGNYNFDGITVYSQLVSQFDNNASINQATSYPPGTPSKMLLPLQMAVPGGLQPHGPLTVAAAAFGPGFTADEVLSTLDEFQIEYKHSFRVAVHAPLPANWTAV